MKSSAMSFELFLKFKVALARCKFDSFFVRLFASCLISGVLGSGSGLDSSVFSLAMGVCGLDGRQGLRNGIWISTRGTGAAMLIRDGTGVPWKSKQMVLIAQHRSLPQKSRCFPGIQQ